MNEVDQRRTNKQSSIIGAATAGTRALASQLFAFYIKIPLKIFRPTRVDYLALPRAINPVYSQKPWTFSTHSGPALIIHAVREHGWQFIPNNILPPLVANSAVGLALYTSYLTSLSIQKRDDGTYGLKETLVSGGIAGGFQSIVAAPIDAIVTRFNASDMIDSPHRNLWGYSLEKLKQIGLRGVFSGFGISLMKESCGFSLFFATFEVVKGAWYRKYVQMVYGQDGAASISRGVFPTFVIMAGVMSTYSLQLAHYPLGKLQKMHFIRLEAVDKFHQQHGTNVGWAEYIKAYGKTFKQAQKLVIKDCQGSWWRWLYSGYFRNTLISLPSTSIGLVVFEIMRLRYMDEEKPAFVEDSGFYDL